MISEQAREAYRVIREGDLDLVREMIEESPSVLDIKSPYSLIAIAVHEDNVEMVHLLLELGCDPNLCSRPSFAPLMGAIDDGNESIARILLESGADPNIDRTAIGAVVSENSRTAAFLQLLDEFNADLGRSFPLGNSDKQINALTMAIQWGNEAAVEFLKEKGIGMPEDETPGSIVTSDTNSVIEYFEQHFGAVKKQAIVEIVPSFPQIAIQVIPPFKGRSHTTLFTNGMSKHRMAVPHGGNPDYAFAELFVEIEGELPTDFERLASPETSWPIDWLRTLATYPTREDTWLGGPFAIVDNGDPPMPIAPGLGFTSILLLAEKSFQENDGKLIQLYRLTPLYPEEVELEKREGISALMRGFDRFDVPFAVAPGRLNVGSAV